MTEPKQRKEKKSETLEVRIPHDTKQAFLSACREDGTTASEVVRGSIQDYLTLREQPQTQAGINPDRPSSRTGTLIAMIPQPIRKKRWLVAGASAAGLAMFAAMPSAAAPDFKAAFDKLDANHDGVLTAEEFKGPLDAARNMVISTRTSQETKDGKAAPKTDAKTETKEEAYTYILGDGKGGDSQQNIVVKQVHISKDVGDGSAPPAIPDMGDIAKMQFDRFDTNKDGKVTLAEYEAEQTKLLTNGFNRLDSNKDGFLTAAEYAKIGQPITIKIEGGDPADAKEIESKAKAMTSPDKLKAEFAKRDKNKDGKLSLQEYLD